MKQSLMFVCLGNICRSPIAEGCAKKLASEHKLEIQINSSGTGNWHVGETPCENSIKVAIQHGIDISKYKATQFSKKEIDENTLVIALDESNYEDLKGLGVKNLVKLGSYGFNGEDVPDPYFFKGFEGFDKVFSMIETCVKNLFHQEKLL
jgi:protein-tyrosine phosphatase